MFIEYDAFLFESGDVAFGSQADLSIDITPTAAIGG